MKMTNLPEDQSISFAQNDEENIIKMHDHSINKRFVSGEIVFKITDSNTGDDISIANTKHDYEKRLAGHHYMPILYMVSLNIKLAYLYDCLNRHLNKQRENGFIFWWRKIGTDIWNKWFNVNPYLEESLVI